MCLLWGAAIASVEGKLCCLPDPHAAPHQTAPAKSAAGQDGTGQAGTGAGYVALMIRLADIAVSHARPRPRRRQSTPETALIRTLLEGCAARGIPAYRLNSGAMVIGEGTPQRRYLRASWLGAPDLVVLTRSRGVVWVEVKSRRGTLSPDQVRFRDLCLARGITHVVAREWRDLEVFLDGERR